MIPPRAPAEPPNLSGGGVTSHELMIVGGGILLAIFLVPFGGPQATPAILLIALLVVFDDRIRPKVK